MYHITIFSAFLALFIIIGYSFFHSFSSHPKVISDLTVPNRDFLLDRSQEIKNLTLMMKNSQERIVAIAGIGGSGKTTLARLYARTTKANVIWELNAESTEKLISSLEDFAFYLAENNKGRTLELQNILNTPSKNRNRLLLQFIQRSLKERKSWVLIYDNVESLHDIKDLLPNRGGGDGKVIVTTRNSNIALTISPNNVLKLGGLNDKQVFSLFSKIYKVSKDEEKGQEIKAHYLKSLPPFPLDVSIAAHYMRLEGITFKEYTERLCKGEEVQSVTMNILRETGEGYLETRSSIISLSIDKILRKHPEFKKLLFLISLLDSKNVPRDFLDKIEEKSVVDNFIYHLEKHSLISHTKEIDEVALLSFHPVVQSEIFFYLKKCLILKEQRLFLKAIVTPLEAYMSHAIEKGYDMRKIHTIINHAKAFLSHEDYLDEEDKAIVCLRLGNFYKIIGLFDEAEEFLKKSLFFYRHTSLHRGAAIALGYIGSLYSYREYYNKAEACLKESLQQLKKHGADLQNIALMKTYLGNAYRGSRNFLLAEKFLLEGLEDYKKLQNSEGVSWAQTYLGSVYTYIGKYEQALSLLEKSLESYTKSGTPLRRGFVLGHLGLLHIKMKNLPRAIADLKEALKIYEDNYDENHAGRGWLLGLLGKAYKDSGNASIGSKLIEKNRQIYKKHYSEEVFKKYNPLWYLED